MNKNYDSGRIAVNAVIFSVKNRQLAVFLNKRDKDPFKNIPELPGGLLLPRETAEETLSRKIRDLFGSGNIFFKQFYTFTNPSRDPRERVVSIGFIALVSLDKVKNSENFHEVTSLGELAFDHNEIIAKAQDFLKKNAEGELVRHFMPSTFPLNMLQEVYEVVTGVDRDNRNFRKKILSRGLVKRASKVQENVPHRPAALYEFIKK